MPRTWVQQRKMTSTGIVLQVLLQGDSRSENFKQDTQAKLTSMGTALQVKELLHL